MGCQLQPNHGLLIGAIVHLLDFIKEYAQELQEQGAFTATNDLWKMGANVCVLSAALLRRHKGFYLDLAGVCEHLHKRKVGAIPARIDKSTVLSEEECKNLPHVAICLLGKFKGETGVDHHLIKAANETLSGLRPRWWVEKLVEVGKSDFRSHGPVFAMPEGVLASSTDYVTLLRKYLHVMQEETKLIPGDQDVDALYSTFRTPRKTATTRIERAGFGNQFVDQLNRWRPQEKAQGRAARRRMNAHYAEALLLMPTTWIGSYVL